MMKPNHKHYLVIVRLLVIKLEQTILSDRDVTGDAQFV